MTSKTKVLRLKHTAIPTISIKDKMVILLMGVGAIGFVYFLINVFQNVGLPQMEFSEGNLVYISNLMASGKWDWQPFTGPPFQTSFYTPIWYYVVGFLGGTLFSARILMVICCLLCCGLVFEIVYHVSKNTICSVIAALLPMTQYIIIQWGMMARVDMLAAMFELFGVFFAVKYWNKQEIAFSIPFFILAFMTKQSYVIGALALVIALIIQKRKILSVAYTVLIGLFVIIGLVFFNILTNGGFITEILTLQKTVPAFYPLTNWLLWLILDYWTWIPLLMLALPFIWKQPKHYLTIYLGLSMVSNFILVGRLGSAQNYQFELIFIGSIMAGLGLPEIIKTRQWVISFLLTAVTMLTLFAPYLLLWPDKTYTSRVDEAISIIKSANYPILTENTDILTRAGKTPYLVDPFVYMNLNKAGIWNEKPLLDDLNSHKIPFVITQERLPETMVFRFDPEVQQAITDNYHVVVDYSEKQYFPNFVIYEANK